MASSTVPQPPKRDTEAERLREALQYAVAIIRNYEADIHASGTSFVGVDLVAIGFCQGVAYKEAINDICRYANGWMEGRS